MIPNARCNSFIEDLGAHAAGAGLLRAEAAAHLVNCAMCRNKLAELKAAAAIQLRNAESLPPPRFALETEALKRAIHGPEEKDFAVALRPVFACAVVIVGVSLLALSLPKRREVLSPPPVVQTTPRPTGITEPPGTAGSFEPTLGALRREVQTGHETLLASTRVAAGLRHYRVKDVEQELRN